MCSSCQQWGPSPGLPPPAELCESCQAMPNHAELCQARQWALPQAPWDFPRKMQQGNHSQQHFPRLSQICIHPDSPIPSHPTLSHPTLSPPCQLSQGEKGSHTHTAIGVRAYTHVHTCLCTVKPLNTRTCTHTCACTLLQACPSTQTFVLTHMRTPLYSMAAHITALMHAHSCVSVHTHTHTHPTCMCTAIPVWKPRGQEPCWAATAASYHTWFACVFSCNVCAHVYDGGALTCSMCIHTHTACVHKCMPSTAAPQGREQGWIQSPHTALKINVPDTAAAPTASSPHADPWDLPS